MISTENELFDLQLSLSGRSLSELEAEHAEQVARKSATAPSSSSTSSSTTTKKQYKWSVSTIDQAFRFDHASAVGAVDLAHVDWSESNVIGIERSEKGSEGLFFVQHRTAGALVVKRSKAIGSEIFCTLLALRLGIPTPLARIVVTTADDGVVMLTSLNRKDPLGRVASTLYEQYYLILIQYQQGVSFGAAGADRMAVALADAAHLRQLGAILALDVLVNNVDRLPLIWDHQGNAGNLMLNERNEPVSIDGQIVGLRADSGRAEYMERVRHLLAGRQRAAATAAAAGAAAAAPRRAAPQFGAVRAALRQHCHVDIGSEGELALEDGLWSVVERARHEAIGEQVAHWAGLLARFQNPPLADLPQIQADFVAEVWQIFADAAA